ncbi:hypothetical protein FE257_002163 [Aspergillus nanangensis]|uniref:Uncharacterized protein n=1 Tax=Aspergillus nanangensis TaxID=2582783 RepID=A0AAD4CTQ8_ASPNN|nr:hypothetical protein FE257_002163 [Aspergillus nanangensis]
MRLSSILAPLITLFPSSCLSLSHPITTDVLYWPVTSPEPTILARISYDSVSLEHNLLSYSPPKTTEKDSQDQVVRIGLYTSTATNTKQWVGSLTSLSSLREDLAPILQLYLGPSNEVYHVSVMTSSVSTSSPSNVANPSIELVSSKAGPRPHLNRPVVVGPDGTNPDEPAEKTFLQKYAYLSAPELPNI